MSVLDDPRPHGLPRSVTETVEPRTARRHSLPLSLPAGATHATVALGRVTAVWLPVYGLTASRAPSFWDGALDATLLACAWFCCLRIAFGAARLTLQASGVSVAATAGSLGGLVVASGLGLWLTGLGLTPALLLEIAAAVLVLAASWEYLVRQSEAAARRILVVGANDGGSELIEELALVGDRSFDVVGVVDDERETTAVAGAPLLGRLDDLPEIIARHRPDLVVLAVSQNRLEAFGRLLTVATSGFRVVELPQFYEQAFGRVPVRRLTSAWFMSVLHLYQRPYTRCAKRTFDIVVALIGLALTAPAFPLIALLVKLTGGPLIYSQTRLGEAGRLFTIYKFRTMRADAEDSGRALWAEERDPRITATGRFLRRTRLDELPQLWNVLRGQMSIVGPRPERPEFVELLEQEVPFWSRRHLVKPGITGWAQVSCGYTSDADGTVRKLSYDLWYLRHRSLAVDLGICAKTVLALGSGAGAR